MKKNNTFAGSNNGSSNHHIPDIDIIDLELDGNTYTSAPEEPEDTTEEASDTPIETFPEEIETQDSSTDESSPAQEITEEPSSTTKNKKSFRSFLNIHVLLLAVFLLLVGSIIIKFSNWGEFIDPSEIESDHSIGYQDALDHILPLMDAEGNAVPTGKAKNIVVFGNSPFADDRDSKDNLAKLIADATGANVYNCSIGDSYLASRWVYFDANIAPMDAYCFYWLVTLATTGANEHYYSDAANALGDATPSDAQEVYNILTSLDFSTVDTVVVMYDATDYLMGHEMYDDANRTNITQFTGNLEAGIELLQATNPHIRIIVLSPTYAYALNEEGEYVSSDIQRYGQDVLSTYVIKQSDSCSYRSVSFVDNLYGTITEDNASDYLIDNLHLNVNGRKLVAQRFVDALNRYSKD